MKCLGGKKGQIVVYWIMAAIVVFFFAVAFSKPLVDSITATTNATNLNCTNPANNVAMKATCVVVDVGLFYFIGIVIAASIAIISGKRTLSGIMVAIFVFVVVISMIMPLKEGIVDLRDPDHLNCAGTTLVGAKMACIVVDLWLFYFVLTAIAAGATYLTIKYVVKDEE